MGKFDRYFDDDAHEERERLGAPARRGVLTGGVSGLPPGEWVGDGVYLMEALYRLGSPYGAGTMGNPDEMETMRHLGASGTSVFLDLETTGLSGGTGTYAFLCGIGTVRGDFFKVSQFFLESPACEARWLDAVDSSIPPHACLVTYNGRTFDLPLLRTRHIMTRKTPHWRDLPHIDLLHLSRRLYRGYLESCSLGSVERNVLRLERGSRDIPGALIPALYTRYLQSRDASELGGVFYHNELDIASLASLYCHIARVLDGAAGDRGELLRAGDIWHRLGHGDRAALLWNMACLPPEPHVDAMFRRARRSKKNNDFASARDDLLYVLRGLRGGGRRSADGISELDVLEELAKLEEHRFKSPERALEHVEAAAAWLRSNGFMLGRERAAWIKSMEHRGKRLIKKIRAERASEELRHD
ncbi:MAG: ribonuclease H-like domain-containing protein [Synergistaceae bacterium]|nr:ribonuclease H-like domain-containing protein [Synergistaceae bacterium]